MMRTRPRSSGVLPGRSGGKEGVRTSSGMSTTNTGWSVGLHVTFYAQTIILSLSDFAGTYPSGALCPSDRLLRNQVFGGKRTPGLNPDIPAPGNWFNVQEDEEPYRFVASFGTRSSVHRPGSSQDTTLPSDTTRRPQPVAKCALLLLTAQASSSKRCLQGALNNSRRATGGGRGSGSPEGATDKRHEGAQFDKEAMRALQGERRSYYRQ